MLFNFVIILLIFYFFTWPFYIYISFRLHRSIQVYFMLLFSIWFLFFFVGAIFFFNLTLKAKTCVLFSFNFFFHHLPFCIGVIFFQLVFQFKIFIYSFFYLALILWIFFLNYFIKKFCWFLILHFKPSLCCVIFFKKKISDFFHLDPPI
jgi:hypothetical protein